jgi:hypothetical protein
MGKTLAERIFLGRAPRYSASLRSVRRGARAFSIFATILWLLPVSGYAAPAMLDGKWYDQYLRSYVFLPDGLVVREVPPYSERAEAPYALENITLTMRFAERHTPSRKPLVLKGAVKGDVISLANTGDSPDDRSLTLHRAPPCAGKSAACGAGVFCVSGQGARSSFWRFPARQPGGEFEEFMAYFGCAVHLKQRDLYMPHVSFPLREERLFPDKHESTRTSERSFNAELLEKDVASPNYRTYQPPEWISPAGRARAFVVDDGKFTYLSEREWHFEKQQGEWRMVMVERPAMPPETGQQWRLPWFQLKHCGESTLKDLAAGRRDTAQGEDFETFVIEFYCALKKRRSDQYMPRTRLPLPFVEYDSERKTRGVIKQDPGVEISVVDGGEFPLIYSARGNRGSATMRSQAGGMSNEWIFERIAGKWYLVRLDLARY